MSQDRWYVLQCSECPTEAAWTGDAEPPAGLEVECWWCGSPMGPVMKSTRATDDDCELFRALGRSDAEVDQLEAEARDSGQSFGEVALTDAMIDMELDGILYRPDQDGGWP